jgi:transcriptional antiterminator RfaH
MNSRHDNFRWYVIHTHLRQESRADMNLRSCGITTFSPQIRETDRNPYSGKKTYVIKPLFPRYIFARIKPTWLYRVQFTRGVYRIISFGGNPVPIDDEIISEVKLRIAADGYVCLIEELAPADKVVIKEGPLANFRGIFIGKASSAERVRILLDTVSYQAHLEIERESLMKLNR